MIYLLFALIGWLAGGLINWLADELPRRRALQRPQCVSCEAPSSLWRWLVWSGGACPSCGLPLRRRVWMVQVGTAVLFATLPLFIDNITNLAVNTVFIAILVLVIVIDLEHKLILNVVSFPAMGLGLLGSLLVTRDQNSIGLSLLGLVVGFVISYAMYWFGQLLFGSGAFGYGDVKLAMAMGAMMGFHRIPFALAIGILLGGLISAILLATGLVDRRDALPYGQYLAIGGMIMLIWGLPIVYYFVPELARLSQG